MAYTNIDDPSAYFQTALHSSANAATITNDGNSDLKPDLIWSKARGAAYNHALYDSTRGVTKSLLSNATNAEITSDSGFDLTSFNTDGFSTGNNQFNTICGGTTYVAWQWKANGGTTSSNTDGNITSTVQSNQDARFSLVTYTGNGSNNQTIGHGLGVQPSWWIVKRKDSTGDWWFGASSILGGTSNYLKLNSTAANAEINNIWGDSPTSSTLFRVSNNAGLNASGGTYVAYLFANKQGYSKFGKYVGTGNANGPFVYLGFKPAFVMLKPTTFAEEWAMIDTKRNPFNQAMKQLKANSDGAEYDGASVTNGIDILSNGFKVRTSRTEINANTHTYIYMAFAENPFTTSTGIPTTAR